MASQNAPAIFTCAGQNYNKKFALTLGNDNTIARFVNTGFAPAQGFQKLEDCPNPIDDPEGYESWISQFGDWHPAANSFLLGIGTANPYLIGAGIDNSSDDIDADGVTRPDPPSIGAYEAYPTT